jgi:hypothetical protein
MTVAEALDHVVIELENAGIPATRNPAAFFPAPIGVLVGMPSAVSRTMGARTLRIPVHVVLADPPTPSSVDALYAIADDVADALNLATYEPAEWSGNVNAEPLPAVRLSALVTVKED